MLFRSHAYELNTFADKNKIKNAICRAIDLSIENGYFHFINCADRGIDFWAAEHVLAMRKSFPDIHLELVISGNSQSNFWNRIDRTTYLQLLNQADKVTMYTNHSTNDDKQKCNKYMVDKSSLIIAAWNGLPSNTKKCLDYAIRRGLKVDIIDIK